MPALIEINPIRCHEGTSDLDRYIVSTTFISTLTLIKAEPGWHRQADGNVLRMRSEGRA